MSEQIRSVSVSIEVDTNKQTHRLYLSHFDDLSLQEARERIEAFLAELEAS